MGWCFAKVNNKLAEIFFEKEDKKTKILGHCYVKKEEYKRKKEQQWIKKDSAKFQLVYRDGTYRDINTDQVFK